MERTVQGHSDIDLNSTALRSILDMQGLGIDGIEVLGKYNYHRPFHRIDSETLVNMYELFYVERGEQIIRVNQNLYSLTGGDLIIIHPGEMHSADGLYEKRGIAYWLIGNLIFDSFLGSSKEYGENLLKFILENSKGCTIKVNSRFSELLKKIFKYTMTANSQKNLSDLDRKVFIQYIKILLQEVFFTLYFSIKMKRNFDTGSFDIVQKVKRYISDNITESFDLEKLAYDIAHFSLPHLRSVFKDSVGFSLKDYINRQKIEYSKALLQSGKTVIEVAMDLNFSSSQYFATVFNKYTGIPPSEYKKYSGKSRFYTTIKG